MRLKFKIGQKIGACLYIGEDMFKKMPYGIIRQASFKCRCGNIFRANMANVKKRHTESCGCVQKERAKIAKTVHGFCASAEYRAWQHAKNRCINKNVKNYKDYGGRGVKMCDRWLNSFENFLEDMGKKPSAIHSIDRINVDGDYEPSNCRWATHDIQANNKRKYTRGLRIVYNKKPYTLKQLCTETGMFSETARYRLKSGMSVESVFNLPVRKYKKVAG